MFSSSRFLSAGFKALLVKILPVQKNYSLRNRILQYSFLLLVIFLLFTALFTYYFSTQLLKNSYDSIHKTINLYNNQLNQDLSSVESCLYQYAYSNTDVALMTTLKDSGDTILYQIRVNSLLANTLPYLSSIDGLFIYANRTNTFVSSSRTQNTEVCDRYIKTLLRTQIRDNATDQLNISNWYFVLIDDNYYLIRIIKDTYCYMGAWAKLDTLTVSFTSATDKDTIFLCVSEDGIPLTFSDWSNYTLSPADSVSDSVIFQDNNRQKYLQVSCRLDFCDHYMTVLIPLENILSTLHSTYHFILLFFVFLLIVEVSLHLSVNYFLSKPVLTLQKISEQVQKGDISSKLDPENEHCNEVIQINNALNTLLDEISDLKIDIYEEQITRTEFELRYLKTQIAPHFLINCLTTICSMSNTKEGQAITDKMIRTLSEHLRYALSTKNIVSLSEELYYVKNYLELTDTRFPGCLFYDFDIQESCLNASAFPLLLLMLTENTIKYNMIMGEPLTVKISGKLSSEEKPFRILLTHIDSGSGFDLEILSTLNQLDINQNKPVDGHGIGFYNILKRLSLLYGNTASIHFSNEPGWGARIDINIPYIPYTEPDSSCTAE